MKVVYIAGPYTGTPWEVHANIVAAQERGVKVAELGAMPLIPHSNTPACFLGTQDAQFRYDGTMELCRRCDALITVKGWEDSAGSRREVEDCERRGVPVFHDLLDLRTWLRDGAD